MPTTGQEKTRKSDCLGQENFALPWASEISLVSNLVSLRENVSLINDNFQTTFVL